MSKHLNRVMLLERVGDPLRATERALQEPGPGRLLIQVEACGVCRTDLHIVDGELHGAKLPIVPGHEIVGRVSAVGEETIAFRVGDRVGIPWLGETCGHCRYCNTGAENLCDDPRFTGHDIDGGYAQFTIARAEYCIPIPESVDAARTAPLLCAGLIGYRSYRIALREITSPEPARSREPSAGKHRIGLYGFGAAAHILAQVAVHDGHDVYAFTRPGDAEGQAFSRELGAVWAGGSDQQGPGELDIAILFAPVGALVPAALRAVRKGGAVVCAGIHMSDIPSFPYAILWGERTVKSVANLTREDGSLFFEKIETLPLHVEVERFPLEEANQALQRLREGSLRGAAVLIP